MPGSPGFTLLWSVTSCLGPVCLGHRVTEVLACWFSFFQCDILLFEYGQFIISTSFGKYGKINVSNKSFVGRLGYSFSLLNLDALKRDRSLSHIRFLTTSCNPVVEQVLSKYLLNPTVDPKDFCKTICKIHPNTNINNLTIYS